MARFLQWFVRMPAFALAAACAALGLNGAFGPELGWSGAFLFAAVAYLAGLAQRRAEDRRKRKQVAVVPPRPQLNMLPGLKPQRERSDRAA